MQAFVGVTDLGWYRALASHGLEHEEVNFWFPHSKVGFSALDVGQPFLFKTHVDRSAPTLSDKIVGVGLYSGFARLRLSEAWALFGEANGVESHEQLRTRISKYLEGQLGVHDDPEIGCVLLNSVQLLAESRAIPAPSDFAKNIVRGKTYDVLALDDTHSVVEAVFQHRLAAVDSGRVLDSATFGEPALAAMRIGQQAFKAVVGEKYLHRCAVTGDKVRPVLQAAHILPVSKGGEHRVDNGLYLRSDVHTLFDAGYLGLDANYQLRVSPALRAQFGNGDWFYSREGEPVHVPSLLVDRPNRDFLDWHADEVFIA